MIETVIRDHLKKVLDVQCLMEMPEKQPKQFVLIEKSGSALENHITSAIITIQSYADTMLHAAQLNEHVKRAMLAAAQLDAICKVELNSDYNYTDTQMKKYRYQAVFDLIYYEEET